MAAFHERMEFCPVCRSGISLKQDQPLPPACPFCGTDLANPGSEILWGYIECEYIKGAVGINDGALFVTNQRIFWIKGEYSSDEFGGGGTASSGGAFALGGITAAILNKGTGQMQVNLPLSNYAGFEDCKKGLRKGVAVKAKSGESFGFFIPNLGKPQPLKDLLAQCPVN